MKTTYTYEVITIVPGSSPRRRSFDHLGLAKDYACLEYIDSLSVFVVRRPNAITSLDYCPVVWRVEDKFWTLERASVLDLLAYLV